eukprot:12821536-Prorocentrum_lima.AAC.1
MPIYGGWACLRPIDDFPADWQHHQERHARRNKDHSTQRRRFPPIDDFSSRFPARQSQGTLP